jgi:hypothetical protein
VDEDNEPEDHSEGMFAPFKGTVVGDARKDDIRKR